MAMQNLVNRVKFTALGVADSLTPVLKVNEYANMQQICSNRSPHTVHASCVYVGIKVQGFRDDYP